MSYPCAYASFHVEHVAKEHLAIEGAEAEVEHQEEQQSGEEYVGEDQEQNLEQDLTDFYNTQGKHRCMINLVPFTIES